MGSEDHVFAVSVFGGSRSYESPISHPHYSVNPFNSTIQVHLSITRFTMVIDLSTPL